ncbi:MAG: nuclear transport factor 2 family protein [Ignavibacteriales bacterium]|nr:nuclear transport factor 2 family protein [Ignavibacteriales bacterium]
MKYLVLAMAFVMISCESDDRSLDEQNIETTIRHLHVSLKNAYTTRSLDADSLLTVYYDPNSYYVTPWATSETLDSTKMRLRSAVPLVSDYDFSVESMNVRAYGNGAYAFFVLRQDYKVNGVERSEYLPTTLILEKQGELWRIVHAHRSADPETWRQWFGSMK